MCVCVCVWRERERESKGACENVCIASDLSPGQFLAFQCLLIAGRGPGNETVCMCVCINVCICVHASTCAVINLFMYVCACRVQVIFLLCPRGKIRKTRYFLHLLLAIINILSLYSNIIIALGNCL